MYNALLLLLWIGSSQKVCLFYDEAMAMERIKILRPYLLATFLLR